MEPATSTPRPSRRPVVWMVFAFIVLIGTGVAINLLNGSGAPSTVQWLDYEAAVAEADQAGKPILINFTGEAWCPPCKSMNSRVYSNEAVGKVIEQHFVPAKVVKATPATPVRLMSDFGITGVPTLVIVDQRGIEIARHVGFIPADQFIEWCEQAAASIKSRQPGA